MRYPKEVFLKDLYALLYYPENLWTKKSFALLVKLINVNEPDLLGNFFEFSKKIPQKNSHKDCVKFFNYLKTTLFFLDASTLQCVTEKLPPQRMTNFLPSYMLNLTSKQTDLAQGLITTKLQPEQIKSGKKNQFFYIHSKLFKTKKHFKNH